MWQFRRQAKDFKEVAEGQRASTQQEICGFLICLITLFQYIVQPVVGWSTCFVLDLLNIYIFKRRQWVPVPGEFQGFILQ
jgi:hypothetical protein